MIAVAERKIIGMDVLKTQIHEKMAAINERLDDVRNLIRLNTLTEINDQGLLTKNQASYLECLELQHQRLNDLLA